MGRPPALTENTYLHCILQFENFTVQIFQMRFSKGQVSVDSQFNFRIFGHLFQNSK